MEAPTSCSLGFQSRYWLPLTVPSPTMQGSAAYTGLETSSQELHADPALSLSYACRGHVRTHAIFEGGHSLPFSLQAP